MRTLGGSKYWPVSHEEAMARLGVISELKCSCCDILSAAKTVGFDAIEEAVGFASAGMSKSAFSRFIKHIRRGGRNER